MSIQLIIYILLILVGILVISKKYYKTFLQYIIYIINNISFKESILLQKKPREYKFTIVVVAIVINAEIICDIYNGYTIKYNFETIMEVLFILVIMYGILLSTRVVGLILEKVKRYYNEEFLKFINDATYSIVSFIIFDRIISTSFYYGLFFNFYVELNKDNIIKKVVALLVNYKDEIYLLIFILLILRVIILGYKFYENNKNKKNNVLILISMYFGFIVLGGYSFGEYNYNKYKPTVKAIGQVVFVENDEINNELVKSFGVRATLNGDEYGIGRGFNSWLHFTNDKGNIAYPISVYNTYEVNGKRCSGEEIEKIYYDEVNKSIETLMGANYERSLYSKLPAKYVTLIENDKSKLIIGIRGFYNFPSYIDTISMIQFFIGRIVDMVIIAAISSLVFNKRNQDKEEVAREIMKILKDENLMIYIRKNEK